MNLASEVITAVLGFVFLFSAAGKLRHPGTFVGQVRDYKIIPTAVAPLVAITVIGAECFLAVAYLTGWMILLAIPVAAATLLLFGIAVSINLRRHNAVPCGCFGKSAEPISTATLSRLLMLMVGVGVVAIAAEGVGTAGTIWTAATQDLAVGFEVAALAIAITLLAMWILRLPQLFAVFSNESGVGG